jgi:hypothetical protein
MTRHVTRLLGITLALLGAYAATTTLVGPWLHVATNLFAGGRSTTKTVGFFLFLAIILCVNQLKLQPRALQTKKIRQVLVSSVVFLFLLGVLGQLYITQKSSGNVFADHIFFSQQEISSSNLTHIHVLKGVVGTLLAPTHFAWQENVDIGLPFLPLLPKYFFVICLLGILFVCIITVLLNPNNMAHQAKRPWLYILCWTLASFSMLKNIVDGGFFNSETLVMFTFWLILLFGKEKKAGTHIALCTFISLCMSLFFYWANPQPQHEVLLHALLQTTSLGLLSLCALHWIYDLQTFRLRVLVLVFTCIALVPSFWRDAAIINYARTTITSEDVVHISSFSNITSATKHASIGMLSFYTFNPTTPTRLNNLLQEHRLLANFYPALVEWQHCFPAGRPHLYSFTLSSNQPLPSQWKNGKIVLTSKLVSAFKQKKIYAASVHVPQCYPRPLNIIHQALRQNGQEVFSITNFTDNF